MLLNRFEQEDGTEQILHSSNQKSKTYYCTSIRRNLNRQLNQEMDRVQESTMNIMIKHVKGSKTSILSLEHTNNR